MQRHTIEVGKDQWLKRRKRSFDRVLVDAPCSGVGAWRRNPDARWLRRTRPLEELLPVQAEVLRRAATLARPGGTLVYATCSLLPDEKLLLALLALSELFICLFSSESCALPNVFCGCGQIWILGCKVRFQVW